MIRIVALALLLMAPPVLAQVAPRGVTPPTRDQIERLPTASQAAPPSRLHITGGIERGPCALDDERFRSVSVTLTSVVFDGLEVVDPGQLAPSYARLIGRPTPIASVCEIRDTAAALLRADGWLAAVQVPPQRIEGGVLHLRVLMAHLVAVHVRGDAGRAERRLEVYLDSLRGDGPFNQRVAERRLLLAGDLPGFDVRLALSPAATTPGEVVGDVTVTRVPVAADVTVQNLGSEAIGPGSAQASVTLNDLSGLGDRLTLGAYNTLDLGEQTVLQADYEFRPLPGGLVLDGRFTDAWSRPSIGQGDPVRARTMIASVEANYPLVLRQGDTVRTAAGLDVINQRLSFAGTPLTSDQLREIYLRLSLAATDPRSLAGGPGFAPIAPRWSATATIELRKGLAALGASRSCDAVPGSCAVQPAISRFDADPQAGLLRIQSSLTLRLSRDLAVVVAPRGQIAFAPLLSFEQFAVGNYTVGRGYDPGALSGDSGYGVASELRYGGLSTRIGGWLAAQPFIFTDVARIWDRGPLTVAPVPARLASLGGGVRATILDRMLLETMLAVPLDRAPLESRRGDVRLLVNLSARVKP